MPWDCSGIVVGLQGPGAPLSQAGAYSTWPKPTSTPTFARNLEAGWATSIWDLSLPSLGLGMLMLQPQGPQPTSASGPRGDCWLWGTHPSGRPHTKPTVLLCPLQSPSPRGPPGCPRRVPALSRRVHRGVPVVEGTCTAGAGMHPGVCMCVPSVRVCVCVCVRRPCATAARGTHRPPRGGTGSGTCPESRGGGGGRQPDAEDQEGKRGSSVRGIGGEGRQSGEAGAEPGARSGATARCGSREPEGRPRRQRRVRPVRDNLVESQGHGSPKGVQTDLGRSVAR